MKNSIALFCLMASHAAAECPPAPDIEGQLDMLIGQINEVANDAAAREISSQMWQLWLQAPDAAAQEALDNGMRARENYDFLGARQHFMRLIEYCPDYAEGYNQRAFVAFLRNDYDAALVDLDIALRLSPKHVGAQSGRALTLMNLGRIDEARDQLQEALTNNPWLSERFLLSKGGPLAPDSEEI